MTFYLNCTLYNENMRGEKSVGNFSKFSVDKFRLNLGIKRMYLNSIFLSVSSFSEIYFTFTGITLDN